MHNEPHGASPSLRPLRPLTLAFWLALLAIAPHFAFAQLTQRTLTYQGMTRTWYEHIPASYNSATPVPLLLFLHGSGGAGDVVAPKSGYIELADAKNFIAVFPNGGLPGGNGTNSFQWNTYFQQTTPDEVGFLMALIKRLESDYRIDLTRIYMTGHSNGASMTNTFAGVHASVLAAIAPVSGAWITTFNLPTSLLKPDAPLPVWEWRGQNENFTTGSEPRNVQDQQQLQFWTAFNQVNPTPQNVTTTDGTYTYATQIYTGGTAEVRFTEVANQSHPYQTEYSTQIWNNFLSRMTRSSQTIAGTITLEGLVSTAAPQSVTFTFRPTDGSATFVQTANVTAQGAFQLMGLPLKRCDVHIKGAKWLARNITIDTTSGAVTGVQAFLPTGDATNDNIVDIADFGALVNSYGGSANITNSGYNSAADFNSDGIVDVADFSIFVNNYGSSGDL